MTGGLGSGSEGGTTRGLVLRPNTVYFGHGSDFSLISSVLPDGSDRRDEGGFGSDVVAATPDVSRAKGFVYAKRVGGAVGVYRGESFDPSASETLAAPGFDDVTSLAVAPDGAVAMVAVQAGRSRVLLLTSGAIRPIDDADGAAISPDGTKVAYSKPEDGLDNLCVWDRATSTVARTVTGGDSLFPSFSKDGAWIVFSSNRDAADSDAPWDIYPVPTGGGAVERLTDTPNLNELGASYNEGRSAVAFVGVSADPNVNGIYVLANSRATRVARDADLTLGTYWTDLAGRSLRVRDGRFQRLSLPRR